MLLQQQMVNQTEIVEGTLEVTLPAIRATASMFRVQEKLVLFLSKWGLV